MNREPLRIVYMGTSVFAVPALEALCRSPHHVIAVVSQPDRVRGRGNRIIPTPVKEAADAYKLPSYQFQRIKDPEALEELTGLAPDLIVVAAYGQIIPQEILDLPPLGCVNIHGSLLPRYRGAAPIQRAIMAGETRTGISTMLMDAGLDTGDILLQAEIEITAEEDYGQVQERLADLGARMLIKTIEGLRAESITARKQDIHMATYAGMISRQDEVIHWDNSAEGIHNHIRALSPTPGAYTLFKEDRIKVFRSRVHDEKYDLPPGTIIRPTPDGFLVQAGDRVLEILEVQKQGKKRIPAPDFLKGFALSEGSMFHS